MLSLTCRDRPVDVLGLDETVKLGSGPYLKRHLTRREQPTCTMVCYYKEHQKVISLLGLSLLHAIHVCDELAFELLEAFGN